MLRVGVSWPSGLPHTNSIALPHTRATGWRGMGLHRIIRAHVTCRANTVDVRASRSGA